MFTRRQILTASIGSAIASPLLFRQSRAAALARVVAIDWSGAEALLALGNTPVGLSDTVYYRKRMPSPVLPESVVDIGPFWEINLELVEALKPDIILAADTNVINNPRLTQVGKVRIVTTTVPPSGRYGLAENVVRQVGEICGLPANVAENVLAAVSRRFAELRAELENVPKRPVLVILPDQSGRVTNIYGAGSLPAAVLQELGLECAWQGPVNAFGVTRRGLDSLLAFPEAFILSIDIPTQRLQTERALARSALWHALPPVRQHRYARIDEFYPAGGVPSALMLAETLVDRLKGIAR